MRKIVRLSAALCTLLGSLVVEVGLFGLLIAAESRQAWRWTIAVGIVMVVIGAGVLWFGARRSEPRT